MQFDCAVPSDLREKWRFWAASKPLDPRSKNAQTPKRTHTVAHFVFKQNKMSPTEFTKKKNNNKENENNNKNVYGRE